MIIETYIQEHIKIVKISGEVNFENYREFGEGLMRSIKGSHNILLDLEGLTYLNSMGLSCIVKAYAFVKKDKRDFKLCALKEPIKKLFTITKLDKMIALYETLEDARSAYKK
ncbi:STAS domain-containing protein [Geosporobacter ferrireducens]|uniref:Anti-sigma factor antagonist n=1 Tax=Geosporobacter ferrireducens TaxID=1424294 RepID=A0A1D8GFU0_9FIRM|nr:STAS domain-containing protein [Geosporobacter ferrireducens]AOT69768.1 hypothetical protein Gferi_09330 [Geosporobacter ferrireducens]MTI54520.1 STAS domain-containing protein [Geosporobacter ferrireducens]